MFVVLCGGFERDSIPGTFPRPLNMINGYPQLHYTLRDLAPTCASILFIYSVSLKAHYFEETVRGLFPSVHCLFAVTQFATRGPVETALAGVLQVEFPDSEQVIFLDNDNAYPSTLSDSVVRCSKAPFVGYDVRQSPPSKEGNPERLAYLTLGESDASGTASLTSIQEKRRISDNYAVGVYGFPSRAQFIHWGRLAMQRGPFIRGTLYFSSVFSNMIDEGLVVNALHLPLPSLDSMASPSHHSKSTRGMRLCFDLDGTLLLPPVSGSNEFSIPIKEMVECAVWARSEGHTIIIHTQRPATAASAAATFATLDAHSIPYDEVIFGKPSADVYIDSRAVNSRLGSLRTMGVPFGPPLLRPIPVINMLPNNNVNSICLEGGKVVKRGPTNQMRGELHFYGSLSTLPSIQKWFPEFYGGGSIQVDKDSRDNPGEIDDLLNPHTDDKNAKTPLSTLALECISGVPLTSLFHHNLMEPYHIGLLFDAVKAFHSCPDISLDSQLAQLPSSPEVMLRSHYLDKLSLRFANKQAYGGLPGGEERVAKVQGAILKRLEKYLKTLPSLSPVIHGDCWFANILLLPDNALKFIDMRGQLDGILTTAGDPVYDFGKLAQSFLGFDTIVFGLLPVSHEYRLKLVETFTGHLRSISTCLPPKVLTVAISLIAGVLPFYDSSTVKEKVWALAEELLEPTLPHSKDLVDAFA